jgi:hypothetical protein
MEPKDPASPNINPSGPPLPSSPAAAPSPVPPMGPGQTVSPGNAYTPTPGYGIPSRPDFPADVLSVAPLPVGQPKHRRKGLVAALIVAAVLLVLGGGAAAAYYYVTNQPEYILKTALANLFNADKSKTADFSGNLSVADEESDFTLSADFDGQIDNESGAFALSAQADVVVTNVTLEARSTDGKTFYFKVGGLEGLPELLAAGDAATAQTYSALVAAVDEQWFEINESLINQLGGGSFEQATLSAADLQKLAQAYDQNQFIVVKETLPDQDIKGVASYHYKVAVDPTKLKAFAAAVKSANLEAVKITDEQLQDFNKAVDEADFGKYPFEIWIGKDDKMIRQISFKYSQDGTSTEVRLTINSYNQPVNVEKPEDAKSILEVLGALWGGGVGSDVPDNLLQNSGISL